MRIKNGVALGCHGRTARTQGVIAQPANYHAPCQGEKCGSNKKMESTVKINAIMKDTDVPEIS